MGQASCNLTTSNISDCFLLSGIGRVGVCYPPLTHTLSHTHTDIHTPGLPCAHSCQLQQVRKWKFSDAPTVERCPGPLATSGVLCPLPRRTPTPWTARVHRDLSEPVALTLHYFPGRRVGLACRRPSLKLSQAIYLMAFTDETIFKIHPKPN